MAFAVGDFVQLLRTLDRLLALEKKHGDLIEALDKQQRNIENRVTTLEARENIVVAEAKAAAAAAASLVCSPHLTELARHIGILEERTKRIGNS